MTVIRVLCEGEHDSRTRHSKTNQEFTLKCANCLGAHTASDWGCPKFPQIKKRVTEGKTFVSLILLKIQILTSLPLRKQWNSNFPGPYSQQRTCRSPQTSETNTNYLS
ncbi:hypothetical protein AVEN_184133-1 [Araneus ventricosus]|uniref:Uncharacterized protein n=1 Tax=Araneus ventricosus TaxID=182803 RepID=A0A4Y2SC12_ARAVE|nr:hypothetical protein AVEN_184133-1 [Araneus ventricosus]